jgi:hypothetical protein
MPTLFSKEFTITNSSHKQKTSTKVFLEGAKGEGTGERASYLLNYTAIP